MEVLGVLLLAAVVGLPFVGRWAAGRIKGPTPVRLTGQVGSPARWLPVAMDKAARGFSSERWTGRTFDFVDDEGVVTGHGATMSGGAQRIKVRLPIYDHAEHFTKERPLVATVEIEAFSYRSHPFYLLFLGKYPDNVAIAARGRVLKQLKKQSKRSARAAA